MNDPRMALPALIEIVPVESPLRAEVAVPGSKSITNRALVLATLAEGRTTLRGALWSEDTQVMVQCLRTLGFEIEVGACRKEPGNRTITVIGRGGEIPRAGTDSDPLELFVGNAGTAARFLAAFVCLGRGVYRLSGISRMHERPQAALFDSLQELGYRIDSSNNKLPAKIHGTGPRPLATCTVSIEESSQFASAILLARLKGGWGVRISGENAEESPYVQMTSDLINQFPLGGGEFQIEPDASSASYIWGADWLLRCTEPTSGSSISVASWMDHSLQIDARFPEVIRKFPSSISRTTELGDSIMTAVVLAPFASEPKRFTELGRLRVQECERVQALHLELAKCGATVLEKGDTLQVQPGELHGAEIETYHDHRVAMCFALLGLRVPGIRLRNPGCVRKTFPNFFQKLGTPAPHGLGVSILDGAGKKLSIEELYAE